MSKQSDCISELVKITRENDPEPTLALMQWSQNLLIRALEVSADELRGALDVAPVSREQIEVFKARHAKILDVIGSLEEINPPTRKGI